jgi:hypothetical protein
VTRLGSKVKSDSEFLIAATFKRHSELAKEALAREQGTRCQRNHRNS